MSKLIVFGFILFILTACHSNQAGTNKAGNSQSTIIPTNPSVPVIPTPSLDEVVPIPANTQTPQATVTELPKVDLQNITGKLAFSGDIYNVQIFMMELPCSMVEKTCILSEIAWRGDFNVDPKISRDGSKMVFVSDHNAEHGNLNIFSYDFATGSFLQLTSSNEDKRNPIWSPDGEMIAYVAITDDYSKIRIIHQNGCCRIDVDQPDGWHEWPSWSPDGTKIVYSSNDNNSFKYTLYIYDIETGSSIRISEPEEAGGGYATWSPDGQWIVYFTAENDENKLCKLNINSGEKQCFSRSEQHILDVAMHPKNNKFAFISREVKSPTISDIFLGSIGTNEVVQLTDSQLSNQRNSTPIWAPNGQFIIYNAFINGDPQPYLVVVGDGYPSIQLANTNYWLLVEDVWTP